MQTHSQSNVEKNDADTANQASVKRSLSFKETELSKEATEVDDKDPHETSKLPENQKDNNNLDIEDRKQQDHPNAEQGNNNSTEPYAKIPDQSNCEVKAEQENLHNANIQSESCSKPKKKRASIAPATPDSIAGRLRQRRKTVDDGADEMEPSNNLPELSEEKAKTKTEVKCLSSGGDSIAARLRSRRQTTCT